MEFDRFNISDAASWQLGWFEGDDYVMAPNSEEILEDILLSASKEGGCSRLSRGDFLRQDFVPFFTRVDEDPKVFALCSKLLLLMTQPLECYGGGAASHTVSMLKAAKNAIRGNPDVFKAMFREVNSIIDICDDFSPSKEDVDTINNCLLILRNIFHISDESKANQDEIFKLVFKAGFSGLYVRLVKLDHGRHFTVSIVQLLSLMFKDVTSASLMMELTFKDDEDKKTQFNNYSQQTKNTSEEDEAVEEEEEESDDDDADSTAEEVKSPSPSEFDEIDNIRVDDRVLRRLNGNPEDDVNRILAVFGVTVLKNGFKDLVANLITYLTDSSNSGNPLDQSYLTWLLSYFLKFIFLPEMTYDFVDTAVSLQIVNFLTYLAVDSAEVLASQFVDGDVKNVGTPVDPTALRRVHLCVMALREVFHSLNYISNCMRLNPEETKNLRENFFKIACLQDLRKIFILLLRTCPLDASYKIYLRDVVTTNHVYLLLLEHILGACRDEPQMDKFRTKFSMLTHVSSFADKAVVRAYGYLLENYEQNSPCLNDCIMTMLHHISGDCGHPETLLQIPILNTFMEIYENEFPLGNESMELIEYILCKFEASCKEEEDTVNRVQAENQPPVVESDVSEYGQGENDSGVNVDMHTDDSDNSTPTGSSMETDMDNLDIQTDTECKADYPFLNQLLINVSPSYVSTLRRVSQNCRKGLDWVSRRLFDACFVRLNKSDKNVDLDHLEEPISFYFHHFGLSTPMVPFSNDENKFLSDPLFINLLTQLGFYLHEGPGAYFPRIPGIWGPRKMFRLATFLSDLTPTKFTEADVERTEASGDKRLIITN